jgi:two-component system sensor histidine kinase BaeS
VIRLPRSLRARLLLANLVVAGVALGTVLVAVSLVGPGYFADAMGHNPNDPVGTQMDAATLDAFRVAIRTALIAALVVAVSAGLIVSFAISSRVAKPVSRLAAAARRIAAGHYVERVPATGEGEIGELATAFNVMTASLEETEHRRLRLVGDVAHELRTPLTTLDGYLEGLEDGVIAPSAETWHLLRGQTARLTRLVSDLQELWRAEARQLPLQVEKLDARTVVGDVVDQFTAQATARGITLDAVLPSAAAAMRADPVRLAQVLGNYLSNALRYAPDGSTVHVVVARNAGEVLVSVRDEGPGLSAEQAAHVFERFYRVDASRSRAQGGAGIGLAIVRALAEAMDGRVWVRSEGPGRGATFGVALPAA